MDNELTDLSFEDALHHLQEMEQMENQEMYYREGQTWTEDGIGCEMQVVGGTTYFTPLANQNNQDRYSLFAEKTFSRKFQVKITAARLEICEISKLFV